MRFCPWYPLADGAAHAPRGPGVFQVRIARGLIDYPSGKSAMVHYQVARDLAAAVADYAVAAVGHDWLCRHTIEMSGEDTEDVDRFHDRLVRAFRARFGGEPTPPAMAPS